MLDRFINDPLKSQTPQQSTLLKGSNKLKISPTSTIIQEYSTARNRPDLPGTSRLSAYLAAGVISPRACLRASMDVNIKGKPQARKLLVDQRDLGVGMWQSELGWRDFYQHVRVPNIDQNPPLMDFYLLLSSLIYISLSLCVSLFD